MTESLDFPILKVLHLDDDPFEWDRIKEALSKTVIDCHFQSHSVGTVDDYKTALMDFKPDVCILDIHIDSEAPTGIKIAQFTRDQRPSTVIIMCSSADDIKTIGQSLNSGADDFISKKTDKGELCLRVYNAYKLGMLKYGGNKPLSSNRRKVKVVGQTMNAISQRVPNILKSAVTAIFIKGESGTGKEVVSEIFEDHVDAKTPFIKINCGSIAPTLLESELFGHVKGSFTGASTDKKGLVESAHGGWLFLDEVATLSPSAQVALLRVLENQEVRKVGASKSTKINVHVISATNENIPKMIEEGRFRSDLWQRLCEVIIELPPLRERSEEIPLLVEYFCNNMEGGPYKVSNPTMEILKAVSWGDGNIRELRNCLRAMTEMQVNGLLTPLSLPDRVWDDIDEPKSDGRESPQAKKGGSSKSDDSIVLPWHVNGQNNFESLADNLLLEMTKKLATEQGKLSLRALSTSIGMSRSTLSGRLKALVHKGVVDISELSKIVNVSDK